MSAPQNGNVLASSNKSVVSVTDSLKSLMATTLRAAGECTGLDFLDQTSLQKYGPGEFLRRMLSTKSYISTTSSNARKNQYFPENPELRSFEKLGEGQTGTVFGLTGTDHVIKVAKPNKQHQLWNDQLMHKVVQEAFERTASLLRYDLTIPRYGQAINPQHDVFWEENMQRFPTEITGKYAFISSRIFGLSLPIRASIVDSFAPKDIKTQKDKFLALPENKHCLIRVYLGRRDQREPTRQFRLRNFDLTVGEMEWLRCDTRRYALTMARALAVLHWVAHVDANDVEFVIGSSPMMATPPTGDELLTLNWDNIGLVTRGLDFHHRSVSMWLLDFDQCRFFEENTAGLEQLKKGFWQNDPYYPRPVSTDPKDVALWTVFKEEYLATSAMMIETGMPKAFITAIEVEGTRRRKGGSMFQ
ncbi:MAG: hypothetical protein Q9184_002450 [Pyrenodesmia sp. 2 TL-2023]